jgi:hypothetical protein
VSCCSQPCDPPLFFRQPRPTCLQLPPHWPLKHRHNRTDYASSLILTCISITRAKYGPESYLLSILHSLHTITRASTSCPHPNDQPFSIREDSTMHQHPRPPPATASPASSERTNPERTNNQRDRDRDTPPAENFSRQPQDRTDSGDDSSSSPNLAAEVTRLNQVIQVGFAEHSKIELR